MTEAQIDIDDDLLAEAQKILGTATESDTVNTALALVVERHRGAAPIETDDV